LHVLLRLEGGLDELASLSRKMVDQLKIFLVNDLTSGEFLLILLVEIEDDFPIADKS